MPAKSRHKKGKFSPQRRPQPGQTPARSTVAQPAQSPAQPAQSMAQPVQSAAPAAQRPAARSMGRGAAPTTPAAMPASYSRLGSELKTIGVIAGSLLVIIIILSFVLR